MHTYVRICTMRMYLIPSCEPSLFLPASEKKLGRLGSRLSTTGIYTYTFTTTMCMHACIHANSHPHMKTSLTHPPPNTHTHLWPLLERPHAALVLIIRSSNHQQRPGRVMVRIWTGVRFVTIIHTI